jgi:hypothetical protein
MKKKLIIFKLIGLAMVIIMSILAFSNGIHVDDGPYLTGFIVGLLLLFNKGTYLD